MGRGSWRGNIASLLVAFGCLTVVLSLPAQEPSSLQSQAETATSDLRVWNTAMGMAFLDHRQYPQT